MKKLVLMRHGESTWNLQNRFTGWKDVDLTERGVEEARRAGRLLLDQGFDFDLAFGDQQVLVWRRSYDVPPPALTGDDERSPAYDPRYAALLPEELPVTECLKDTVLRVVPYWQMEIAPQIRAGRQVIIAAHGNSLRALIKHLDHVSDDAIVGLNIPTAVPLVYELSDDLKPLRNYYLGDQSAVAKAQAAIANQGKAQA